MITLLTQSITHDVSAPALPQLASRRSWLKGLSALLGTGLLAAPTALLASPVAPAVAPLPASAAVGGDEYIGVVKLLAGTELPSGWALCDGRELSVVQHPALFALLGATYGGNGRSTFALPDLRQEMATMQASAARQPAGAAPLGQFFAIKLANAPATTTAVLELRLAHLHRSRHATV
ncbi:hypothetical protein GCM10028822_00470 [Hymenobacter terrigena]